MLRIQNVCASMWEIHKVWERERERERERVGMERHCIRLCACDLKEGMAVCERGKR